jgi:hypothetical protein
MAVEGNFDYASARVCAHHGRRLREADWHLLEASRDLPHYLDAIRRSALAIWVASLDTRDSHAIERSLRLEWHLYVNRVTTWHPREWQAWLAWIAWLPTLSLLAQLARAERAPPWILADPLCGTIAMGTLAERRSAALKDAALAHFEPAISGRIPMATLWRAHWQTLLAQTDAHTDQLLTALMRTLDEHVQKLTTVSGSSMPLREEFDRRLARLFRAGAGTIVATVCHLALLALDLERLRGGLVTRSLFARPASEAA